MIRYRVTAQDSRGRSITITVHAGTDEAACNAALRVLNSWRAVRAMPFPHLSESKVFSEDEVEIPTDRLKTREVEEAVDEPEIVGQTGRAGGHGVTGARIISGRGPRVVRETTVEDWIGDHVAHGLGTGAVGRALDAARER